MNGMNTDGRDGGCDVRRVALRMTRVCSFAANTAANLIPAGVFGITPRMPDTDDSLISFSFP